MDIRPRRPEDLDSVRSLLAAADLPVKGLECSQGWVAEEDGRLVGHVALEFAADGALLRSLVVAPAARGRGLARRLMDLAEQEAGARTVVLRTRTIGPWAERRGYFPAGPEQVPAGVLGTSEFDGSFCCGCPVYLKPVKGAPLVPGSGRGCKG